jgi:hypothetical protein
MCAPSSPPSQAPCLLATQAEGDETVRPALRAPSEMRLGQPASVIPIAEPKFVNASASNPPSPRPSPPLIRGERAGSGGILHAQQFVNFAHAIGISSACSRYVYSILLNKFLHIARHTFLQFGLPL